MEPRNCSSPLVSRREFIGGGSGEVELRWITSRSPHQSSMSLASTRRLAFSIASTSSSQTSGSHYEMPVSPDDVSTVFCHPGFPLSDDAIQRQNFKSGS